MNWSRHSRRQNYHTIITTSTYVKTFGKTVLMAFLATITTLGLAFPLCYWLVRYVPKKLQRVLFLLVILPFWTSYLLRVYAWVAILGDNGAINSLLKALGLTHEPIRLFLYDNPGVYIVLRVRLGPGKPFLQHIDLSSVVRFVFANMKPLAVIVCGSPRPGLVDCH